MVGKYNEILGRLWSDAAMILMGEDHELDHNWTLSVQTFLTSGPFSSQPSPNFPTLLHCSCYEASCLLPCGSLPFQTQCQIL